MSYLTERLEAAVLVLVRDGPVKHRLVRAYSDHLEELQSADLPQKLSEPFANLHAAMHRVAPVGSETRVKASVQKMSAGEAGDHAAAIIKLYVELLRMGQRQEPLKVVESGSSAAAATNP